MNIPYIRAPHTEGVSHPVLPSSAPNAALLIDFDNVTMGMRSDLSKELKTLLQSDVIRGKVTVQRAYADWRRYPQYIVPLSEASVDLIFAPAYGSSKKNATDIRMAIDGMELVFTRPEIGTYILLTGDSDFSSLVLKLKEYGKYVIGVGIQESSSDILVQNCDEYYSYTTLSGLRKAGTGETLSQQDPWTLVQKAVEHMTKRRDVMRSDRLKQVMLDIDSTFDEKAIGFSKFSRFLTEAAQKGLLELRKLDNGQYEVSSGRASASSASSSGSSGSSSRRDRDSSRGGRGRDRDHSRRDRNEGAEADAGSADSPADDASSSAPAASTAGASESTSGTDTAPSGRNGADSGSGRDAGRDAGRDTTRLRAAYDLMVRAIRDLADSEGDAVRDSDVKRRMLAIESKFDESELGHSKFSLFLKQAVEDGVIDLNRGENGIYEVRVTGGAEALDGGAEPADPKPSTESSGEASAPDAKTPRDGRSASSGSTTTSTPRRSTRSDDDGQETRRLRPRLSARRRGANDEPPPLLEGQAVSTPSSSGSEAAGASTQDKPTQDKPEQKKPEPKKPARGRKKSDTAEPSAREKPKARATPSDKPDAKSRGKSTRSTRSSDAGTSPSGSDLPQLGLPSDLESITQYIMNSYKGVGKKTADTLMEAHGTQLFEVMESNPDAIRDLLPKARAETLLEQWVDDVARRRAETHGPAGRPAPETKPRRRSSSGGGRRRGGGGRSSTR